jgi:hypothetical protein
MFIVQGTVLLANRIGPSGMLQIVASLTDLESSIMLLENIYSTGVTHDDNHMTIIIGLYHRPPFYSLIGP